MDLTNLFASVISAHNLMTARFEDHKFDQRTLKRSLREGKVTQKEWEAYLKNLPDESRNAEPMTDLEEEEDKKGKSNASHKEPTFAFVPES